MPSKGDGALSHHLWFQAMHGLTWAMTPASEQEIPTGLPCWTSPSSKLPPAHFVLTPTKRQKEEELRVLKPEASSTLLTPCSSSTSQIWRIFSFAAVSTLSWGAGKQGQTAAAFLQKRAFAACLPAQGQHPAPWRRQLSPLLCDICTAIWNTAM